MTWCPSSDTSVQKIISNPLWEAIESIYDKACNLGALPRRNWDRLSRSYIVDRKFDENRNIEALRSRLPIEFDDIKLGPIEIELIDFVLNNSDRVLILEGPRGAGKTSLIHYIESAIIKSKYLQPPVFIIVDCLADSKGIGPHNFSELFRIAITLEMKFLEEEDPLYKPLNDAVEFINRKPHVYGIQEAFVNLLKNLPEKQFQRIIVVLDNLDQNYIKTVTMGLQLIKKLYIASNVKCITSLRPGCLSRILRGGDAREFFTHHFNITAPKTEAILKKLSVMLGNEAEKHIKLTKKNFKCYGENIDSTKISLSIIRLIDLLRGKRDDDNIIKILDAVSADDIRHLWILLKKIIGHRDLPGEWLIGKINNFPEFHPIPCLFEGKNFLFQSNIATPNLLCFKVAGWGGEKVDYLITHRILRLLSSSDAKHPVQRDSLLRQLSILGDSIPIAIDCIIDLHKLLLIRSTDAEYIDPRGVLPEEFFLTESGSYYLNHMLTYKDYLTTVIVDVPLKHETIREQIKSTRSNLTKIDFSYRLNSLIEYIQLIQSKEQTQISRLINHEDKKSCLNMAQSLMEGGLLSSAVLIGLEEAIKQGYFSKSYKIHESLKSFEKSKIKFDTWIKKAENKLADFISSNLPKPTEQKLYSKDKDTSIFIKTVSKGTSLVADVTLKIQKSCPYAFISIMGTFNHQHFSHALIATQLSDQSNQSRHSHHFSNERQVVPVSFLNQSTIQEIVDLLTPLMERVEDRRELLMLALAQDASPLLQQLKLTKNVEIFLVNMIMALADYGEVTPGKQALWALLEVVRQRVSVDLQDRIDALYPVISLNNDHSQQTFKTTFELPRQPDAQIDDFCSQTIIGKEDHESPLGLLTTDTVGNDITIKFIVLQNNHQTKVFDIGTKINLNDLQKISRDILDNVNTAVIGGNNLVEVIEIMGTKLTNKVINKDGQNILMSLIKSLTTLIIFVTESNLIVPWEWLRPNPIYRDDIQTNVILKRLRIIRWPALHEDEKFDRFHRLYRLNLSSFDHPINSLLTVGLPVSSEYPWRIVTPSSINQLNQIATQFHTIHIVGHYSPDSAEIKIKSNDGNELILNVDKIRAYNLMGPKNLIISACSSGSARIDNNIPIEMSLRSKCDVWTPIASIKEDDANNLDIELSKLSNQQDKTLFSSVSDLLITNSLLYLYVRYGAY